MERIADLVREGKVDGITDLRDESSREGMRIVIELRRDAAEEVILNQLYKMTPAADDLRRQPARARQRATPRRCRSSECLRHFINFRKRGRDPKRAIYDLAQAEARAHILEGFTIALDNLDAVIALIRAARGRRQRTRTELMARFDLSELQAQAILEMRLRALTAMERQRVLNELEELRAKIADLKDLLASDERILDVVDRGGAARSARSSATSAAPSSPAPSRASRTRI